MRRARRLFARMSTVTSFVVPMKCVFSMTLLLPAICHPVAPGAWIQETLPAASAAVRTCPATGVPPEIWRLGMSTVPFAPLSIVSRGTGEPVISMIWQRLPVTLELMGSSFLLAFLFGLSAGIIAALKRYTKYDSIITLVAVVGISIPVFWLGLMSMMLFTVKWRLLPSAGMFSLGMPFSIIDHLRHLLMPSLVLSLLFVASWSRYMRASLSEVLTMNYIDVARAKGATRGNVVFKHAVRNAAIPVLTVIALNLPALFTGSIITETIFAWPGMGRLFYDGLLRQDYPRLMGIIFIASTLIALLNLVADTIYGILAPRIRHARESV